MDSVLGGWAPLGLPDSEIERLGVALFEGLYNRLSPAPEASAGGSSEGPAGAARFPSRSGEPWEAVVPYFEKVDSMRERTGKAKPAARLLRNHILRRYDL